LRTARDLESIAFALTAKTPHAQILQDSVRVLRIRVNGFRAPNAILPEMLPDCLKLFPYLYELRLNVQRVKEFDKAVLKALETDRTTPSRIQSLIIHKSPSLYASNLSVFTGEFTMLHLQLLRIKRWPLKYFAICGDFSFGFCGHYKPPIHQFTAIRLDVPDMGSQLDELMSWLLTNSSNTIEHLSAPRSSSLPREIVEKRRVQSIDCFNLHNLPPTTYSNAEEALWFRLPFVRSTIPDSHLVRSIPKGVKHLGFDADVLPIRLAWWRNLAPSLSKSLKRISVVGYIPSMDMKEDEESISDVLGNIEIRLYANIWDYRTATVSLTSYLFDHHHLVNMLRDH
jgi:hypothetical protein